MNYIYLMPILYIIFTFAEKKYPAENGHLIKSKISNIFYTIFFLIVGGTASFLVTYFLYKVIPFQPRHINSENIFTSLFILFLYVLNVDFFFYWYHRAEHKFKTLWQIHQLHHSDKNLNVTSSMRSYWLEAPMQTIFVTFWMIYIVGINNLALNILPIFLIFWLFLTHANIKLDLKFLTPILCGPQTHRIHHSNLEIHRDKNFAQYFTFIDVIFNTYYHPAKDEYPNTGIKGTETDEKFLTVMIKPFIFWFNLIVKK